jgi:hypothetical protein
VTSCTKESEIHCCKGSSTVSIQRPENPKSPAQKRHNSFEERAASRRQHVSRAAVQTAYQGLWGCFRGSTFFTSGMCRLKSPSTLRPMLPDWPYGVLPMHTWSFNKVSPSHRHRQPQDKARHVSPDHGPQSEEDLFRHRARDLGLDCRLSLDVGL